MNHGEKHGNHNHQHNRDEATGAEGYERDDAAGAHEHTVGARGRGAATGPHGHAASHTHDDTTVADTLDLDAEVLSTHLDEVIAWVVARAGTPHTIADVGAGTGTGTLALARRFPAAELIAIDRSPVMLQRLKAAVGDQALADRLRVVLADLDHVWPTGVAGIDLAWAASSLHHLRDPDRLLAALYEAVNPGGVLAVVEMDGVPRFLPEDIGIGRPGLQTRCREIVARLGWNAYPNWTKHLERAGFVDVAEQTFDYDVHPLPPTARRYAIRVLSGMRHRLADQLAADDLATLDLLLAADGPASLLHRDDLVVRGSRTVWAARRP